jgi:hypothetical protein
VLGPGAPGPGFRIGARTRRSPWSVRSAEDAVVEAVRVADHDDPCAALPLVEAVVVEAVTVTVVVAVPVPALALPAAVTVPAPVAAVVVAVAPAVAVPVSAASVVSVATVIAVRRGALGVGGGRGMAGRGVRSCRGGAARCQQGAGYGGESDGRGGGATSEGVIRDLSPCSVPEPCGWGPGGCPGVVGQERRYSETS